MEGRRGGRKERRERKSKSKGKRKAGGEEEKRRGEKEKKERGETKEAVLMSPQVGPQLPLGSVPSAQGGSTSFKGVAPCGEGELGCSPVSDGQKGRAA